MAVNTHGSNLGANEAAAGETALHVLGIELGANPYIDVQVETEGFYAGDPKILAVLRNANSGAILARTLVSTDADYPFYGLLSFTPDQVGRGRLRPKNVTADTTVRFEVYAGAESVSPSGEPDATGPAYRLGDLTSGVEPPPDEGAGNPLNDATELVDSVTTAAIFAGAAYVATPFIQDFISDE